MHHLQKIQTAGGDAQHPIDDPLWSSWQVNWFLRPRPPVFDKKKRKAANYDSQHRYYKARKRKQAVHADEMKHKLDNREINEEEYMKYLIGDRRRQFITEMRVKARIGRDVRNENEKKLQEEIERCLQELRNVHQSNSANANAIAALKAAQTDLHETQATVNVYK